MSESYQNEARSAMVVFRRAFRWWPYVLLSISITGFLYIALNLSR